MRNNQSRSSNIFEKLDRRLRWYSIFSAGHCSRGQTIFPNVLARKSWMVLVSDLGALKNNHREGRELHP